MGLRAADLLEFRLFNGDRAQFQLGLARVFVDEVALDLILDGGLEGFLLGAQLLAIVRFTPRATGVHFSMHTRGIAAFFKGAFRSETTLSLEEQLFAFPAA